MIMLGIIGEYIWRIYDNQRGFPRFIVELKSLSGHDDSSKTAIEWAKLENVREQNHCPEFPNAGYTSV